MKILAIIPARGGSKAVPKKNIRALDGKPLLYYSIDNCKKSKFVNRIVVSTDDNEISKISAKYDAEIVMRPEKISGDSADSETALLHVLNHLKHEENYEPDYTVFIQCTSPLIIPEDIDNTIRKLLDCDADMVHTVTPFHGFIWEKNSSDKMIGVNHDFTKRLRRQDLPLQYQETGAVYAMKTEGFLKEKNRFFGEIATHIIPVYRSLEINDFYEFQIAEFLIRNKVTNIEGN